MNKKFQQNLSVVNLGQQDIPYIVEDTKTRYQWVPFGVYGHDDFFDSVSTAWNVSTTNSACIEGIADLIFGKGLYSHNEEFNTQLQKIIPQEEIKFPNKITLLSRKSWIYRCIGLYCDNKNQTNQQDYYSLHATTIFILRISPNSHTYVHSLSINK